MNQTLELHRLREIADLAKQVREAQRKYFKTRDRTDLAASKQIERRLDDALANARTDRDEARTIELSK